MTGCGGGGGSGGIRRLGEPGGGSGGGDSGHYDRSLGAVGPAHEVSSSVKSSLQVVFEDSMDDAREEEGYGHDRGHRSSAL